MPASPSALDPDLEPCPGCARPIPRNVSPCPHCGAELEDDDDTPLTALPGFVRRDTEPHRGSLIFTFGILSTVFQVLFCVMGGLLPLVGFGLGIAAIVMGKRDLAKMDVGTMDPAGRRATSRGVRLGIIGICLFLLIVVSVSGIAVMFLVPRWW
jgi:hypothetical protein